MFETITNPEERGQVGIGTLIVFIAMVLVAAIAAGVLINTAGFLQTQAEATGQDSTDLVSERINVNSAVGLVSSQNTEELAEVRLTVSGAPGADDIDLSDTTIQAVGPGGQENLVFAAGGSIANTVSDPGTNSIDVPSEIESSSSEITVYVGTLDQQTDGDTYELTVSDSEGNSLGSSTVTQGTDDGGEVTVSSLGDISSEDSLDVELTYDAGANVVDTGTTTVVSSPVGTVDDIGANEFAVQNDGSFMESSVLGNQEQYTIVLNPEVGALEQTENPNNAFGQSDSATLDIVSPSGATTSVELRAPDLFNENGEAVRL
jgi:flagellin FlaB